MIRSHARPPSKPIKPKEPPSISREEPAAAPIPARPPLALIEHPENVVPMRGAASDPLRRPVLTPGERNAFREIARALGARLQADEPRKPVADSFEAPAEPPALAPIRPEPARQEPSAPTLTRAVANGERAVLDRLPLGVVVHRRERILYVNRVLLDWTGLSGLDALNQAGGLKRLFSGAYEDDTQAPGEAGRTFAISGRNGEPIPVEARLLSAPWEGESALVYVLRRAGAGLDERLEASELALREAEATTRELRAILDTATDGVLLIDRDGKILGINRTAEALFGFDAERGRKADPSPMLFAEESQPRSARLSRRAGRQRRRQRTERRPRGDRPRARGRADSAVHDHRPRRREHRQVLRRAARHHRTGSAPRRS